MSLATDPTFREPAVLEPDVIRAPDRADIIFKIKAITGWSGINLAELWRHRELLFFFSLREIKVRYKQTALGVAWVVIQPLCAMLIFTVFLGRLGKIPSDGLPYPVFVFAGLVPWTFFANTVSTASSSLVNSANLITKVYFPRLIMPMACVFAGVLDLLVMLVLLGIMLTWYHIGLTARALWLPAFAALAGISSMGMGMWLSSLNVKYRDVKHTVPFMLQMWLFATPVAYPSSLVPERFRSFYGLNPIVSVVEGFRWCLLGGKQPPPMMVAVSALAAICMLLGGAFYFRRVERVFADII